MNDKQPSLTRLAGKVHACLSQRAGAHLVIWEDYLSHLCRQLEALTRIKTGLAKCAGRNWLHAAERLERQLIHCLGDLSAEISRLPEAIDCGRPRAPSFRHAYEELRQLGDELGQPAFDRQEKSLSVTTDPIEFEGVYLGEFEIRLLLSQPGRWDLQGLLRVVALDPHPATCEETVTHPHVRDERLCAGDAASAICSAWEDGRLCDLFLLVRSVLTTYNAESPYVSLEKWEGQPCHDCGYTMSEDDGLWCEACENDFCDDCISSCSICGTTRCQGCLTTCQLCDGLVCDGCLEACSCCAEPCCTACLDESLCPSCKQEDEESDENENREQDESAQPETDRCPESDQTAGRPDANAATVP